IEGDRLQFGDDEGAGELVSRLVAQGRVGAVDKAGDAVVLAQEERVHGGQLDVLVGPYVAGNEELVVGDDVGVVGDGEGGGRVAGIQVNAREVGLVVERQHVISRADHPIRSGTALQLAAGVGAKGVGDD